MIYVFIILLAFIARVLAGRGVRQDHDSRAHLYYALRLKKLRGGPFSSITVDVVTSPSFYNPFMWHWLVSLLPIRFVMKYQNLCNPLLDSLFAAFVYWAAIKIGFSHFDAICSTSLYVLTPNWFSRLAMGPRTHSFTPRLSGEIATNIFFAVILLPLGLSNTLTIILAIISCLFVLTSSKFGIQALLFLTSIISVFIGTLEPIIYLLISVFIACLLSNGKFFKSIKKQLDHLRWYFFKNLRGEMHVSNRNKIGPEYFYKKGENVFKYSLRVFRLLCTNNSFAGVVIKLPILILIFVGISNANFKWDCPYLFFPVIAATLVYLIINIPQLLFLGEAERYLNHIAIFIVLLVVNIVGQLEWEFLIYGFWLYGILYLLGESFILPKFNYSTLSKANNDADAIINYLKKIPQTVVLSFPFHTCDGFYRIMTETLHKTVFIGGTISIEKKYADRFNSNHPYVKLKKLDEMRLDLGVNILVINNFHKIKILGPNWTPPKNWNIVDLGCEITTVYIYN